MAERLDNILCATDFSEFSGRVLDYSIMLARRLPARLYVFHAVNFPSDRLYSTDILERGFKQKRLCIRAREEIERLMKDAAVDWRPLVFPGDPAEQIRRIVDEKGIDLVVAASHGLSGFKRILLGTVVERLARNLNRPLLVIRPDGRGGPNREKPVPVLHRVLLGCPGPAGNDPVLAFAVGFADRLQADLHLLHAIEAPMDEKLVDPMQGPYGEMQDRLQDRLQQRLARAVSDETKKRRNLEITVTAGIPGEALAIHAAKTAADLIVVGVEQHGVLEKLLVGSTTESILRQAPCPVLTVPYRPGRAQRQAAEASVAP